MILQHPQLLLLILLSPLVGFFVNGVLIPLIYGSVEKTRPMISGLVATLSIGFSFLASITAWVFLLNAPKGGVLLSSYYDWVQLGDLLITFELRVDSLSSLMMLVITGVGSLIHLYSIGYMENEKGSSRYFSYLNLFCFFMLLLVMSGNLPFLFFGWEGVGLCSYLLIGYWYKDLKNSDAGKKAFIVNRVGDFFFLLGMFLCFKTFGTLDFESLRSALPNSDLVPGAAVLSAIGLFFFLGATGKSAQIPLFVWLPDAMAGPTPVSALIHAATMVTAGVYLVARMSFLYDMAPLALEVVALVGGFTAFLAATIAISQNDIKKVLAYSTVSQLGFMFLALGMGAYQTAIFHLMTHAFFKALLFLGSGSVIHGCQGEQDMRKMGGLRSSMPTTFATMAAGAAAICGLPFFSGFFSKDEILFSVLASEKGNAALYLLGMFTAFLTAVYMTRMMVMTFYGSNRSSEEVRSHLHESPFIMTIPLMILAFFSIFSGLLGVPHLLAGKLHFPHSLENWLNPAVTPFKLPVSGMGKWIPIHEGVAMAASVLLAVGGILLGWKYFSDPTKSDKTLGKTGVLKSLLEEKYFIDEIYFHGIVEPLKRLSAFFLRVVDQGTIDALVVGAGRMTEKSAQWLRIIQTGDVQLFSMMLGMGLLMLLAYLMMNLPGV